MQNIDIDKTDPIYKEVISFLNLEKYKEDDITYLGFSKKRNLKVILNNEETIIYQNIPKEWINKIIEEQENQSKEIFYFLKYYTEFINLNINNILFISEDIKYLLSFHESFYNIRIKIKNKSINQNYSYKKIIELGKIKKNNENYFDFVLDYLTKETIILINNIDKNIFYDYFVSQNRNDLYSCFEKKLSEIYNKKIRIKNGLLEFLVGTSYMTSNVIIENLFNYLKFKLKYKKIKGLSIPCDINFNEIKLQEKVKMIEEMINKQEIYLNSKSSNSSIEDKINDINKSMMCLYTGVKKITCDNQNKKIIYNNDSFILVYDCKYFTGTESENQFEIKFKPPYQKLSVVESDDFIEAIKFAKKTIQSLPFTLDFKNGEGILFGDTTVEISNMVKFTFKIQSFNLSLDEWKENLIKNIEILKNNISEQIKNKSSFYRNKYPELCGSFIVRDIISLIRKNEKYITENTVVQNLKGLVIQTSAEIKNIKNSGCYQNVSSEFIHNVINNLIKYGFLYNNKMSGTYGDFYTLKIRNSEITTMYKVNETNILEYIENNISLNCDEMEYLINKPNKNTLDYLGLVKNITNKEFLCFYEKEYVEIMKQQQTYVTLLKMKLDIEEFNNDKYIKNLVKKIIKESKNA